MQTSTPTNAISRLRAALPLAIPRVVQDLSPTNPEIERYMFECRNRFNSCIEFFFNTPPLLTPQHYDDQLESFVKFMCEQKEKNAGNIDLSNIMIVEVHVQALTIARDLSKYKKPKLMIYQPFSYVISKQIANYFPEDGSLQIEPEVSPEENKSYVEENQAYIDRWESVFLTPTEQKYITPYTMARDFLMKNQLFHQFVQYINEQEWVDECMARITDDIQWYKTKDNQGLGMVANFHVSLLPLLHRLDYIFAASILFDVDENKTCKILDENIYNHRYDVPNLRIWNISSDFTSIDVFEQFLSLKRFCNTSHARTPSKPQEQLSKSTTTTTNTFQQPQPSIPPPTEPHLSLPTTPTNSIQQNQSSSLPSRKRRRRANDNGTSPQPIVTPSRKNKKRTTTVSSNDDEVNIEGKYNDDDQSFYRHFCMLGSCLKRHLNGDVDGCGLFAPSQDEKTCEACGCHRSFHIHQQTSSTHTNIPVHCCCTLFISDCDSSYLIICSLSSSSSFIISYNIATTVVFTLYY